MKHAEKLIGRIIFVEGAPRVDHLNRGRPHRLAKGTAGPDQQIGIELCLADQTKE
jgi:bacterioferritin (cytochrome b1)